MKICLLTSYPFHFASTAASASGLVAGMNAMNRSDITVVAVAGDGGTFDIGIQALKG